MAIIHKKYKIITTIPEKDADMIREVIGKAGGGKIGNYDFCSSSIKGIGRFRALEGSNPTIGEVSKLNQVEEERIEITCDEEVLQQVVKAIKENHPYEEPIIDIYPLEDLDY
ncbi:MAG: hypothetical protein NTY11_01710 [Candidatus Parcubacteria bacterium]|nr:hypothetical protein [Candidatus Parcubacteria bacterium]